MAAPKGNKFAKGRPKGKPNKLTADIKAVAQQYGPEAIDVLLEVMRDVNHSARVPAAKELLDRAYGKPPQASTVEVKTGIESIIINRYKD